MTNALVYSVTLCNYGDGEVIGDGVIVIASCGTVNGAGDGSTPRSRLQVGGTRSTLEMEPSCSLTTHCPLQY